MLKSFVCRDKHSVPTGTLYLERNPYDDNTIELEVEDLNGDGTFVEVNNTNELLSWLKEQMNEIKKEAF